MGSRAEMPVGDERAAWINHAPMITAVAVFMMRELFEFGSGKSRIQRFHFWACQVKYRGMRCGHAAADRLSDRSEHRIPIKGGEPRP
jgi:hypothetical protein